MMGIVKAIRKIIRRLSFACFEVEDMKGRRFIVQTAWKLEELYQSKAKA